MESAGLRVVRDVDRAPFRDAVQPIYSDPEFATPDAQELIERIRAVRGEETT
jgi:hypothetical protein